MRTKLSNQASMVNAHIASRMMDDTGFQYKINQLCQTEAFNTQRWLCAYIKRRFKKIKNADAISAELVQAWSTSPGNETSSQVKQLVRQSRSTFLLGLVASAGAVFIIGLMVSSVIDTLLNNLLLSML